MTAQRLTDLPVWVRVNNDGVITGRCAASTVSVAYVNLPCRAGELIVSQASYVAGGVYPRPVIGRLCPRCERVIKGGEVTEQTKSGVTVHSACLANRRASQERYRGTHAARKAPRGPLTGRQVEAQRQGRIARGIANRAAKRREA